MYEDRKQTLRRISDERSIRYLEPRKIDAFEQKYACVTNLVILFGKAAFGDQTMRLLRFSSCLSDVPQVFRRIDDIIFKYIHLQYNNNSSSIILIHEAN